MRLDEASRLSRGDVVEFSDDVPAHGFTRYFRAVVLRLVRADGDRVKVRVIDARSAASNIKDTNWIGEDAFAQQFGEVVKEVPARLLKAHSGMEALR